MEEEAITVRIIPGCPSRVLADTEEEREVVEKTLANLECGCVVEAEVAPTPEFLEEAAKQAREEGEEELAAEFEEEAAEKREPPVCSLEPEVPWEQSVCGIVAAEAGEIAAEKVMARLREEGLIQ